MSLFPTDDAERKAVIAQADRTQRLASDPMASVFVSASAGSGKTKLLIDRLLRLMLPMDVVDPEDGHTRLLEGANPARIVCLTYTKAAAAEMANRLQARLGEWVSLPDEALGRQLASLDVPNTEETRALARQLFLKVMDVPGGLGIETIHAFCQSLLRRFPLEASVDPHFGLMEETDTRLALRQAMEKELARSPLTVEALAGSIPLDQFFRRLRALNAESSRALALLERWAASPGGLEAAYRRVLKAGEDDPATMEAALCRPSDEGALRADLRAVLPMSSAAARQKIEDMLHWLAQVPDQRQSAPWAKSLLTDKETVRDMSRLVGKKAHEHISTLRERLEREANRLIAGRERLRAAALAAVNAAMMALAGSMLAHFRDEKAARGLVDYGDLIHETRNLLENPGASWVMYKLDGGIDHLLLDEVQDNSGLQWEIAAALTDEFFAGEGARTRPERPRTIFAVGDYKQSIFGFQGADPDCFHHWRQVFAQRVKAAGLLWRDPELNVSFRSVTPVLALVDAVFAMPLAAHGLLDGRKERGGKAREEEVPKGEEEQRLSHLSARPGQGGRVELWPLVPHDDEPESDPESGMESDAKSEAARGRGEASPWQAPTANQGQRSAAQRLADSLAAWMAEQIGRPPQPGQAPLKAGDILVLVPRRSALLTGLIRALKTRGVPVATLVGVGLTTPLAVRDLLTLCAALLLPQDDLTLASVLTSPLGGLSDDSLMDLATQDRRKHALGQAGQPLWTVLRERHEERCDWRAAWGMLSGLYRRVDYASPYQLLAETLGGYGGRARLLQRLGPEAAEPVDELLGAALRYETLHPPSLQGFLHWLEASDITFKREPESEGDAVRVMTVHGAKGLQARLVVMPDTVSRPPSGRDFLWETTDGLDLPLLVPRAAQGTAMTETLNDREREQKRAEANRLLYVALTRASDWLVICGASGQRQPDETSWYRQCEAGFDALPNVREEPFALGWGDTKRVMEEAPQVPPGMLSPECRTDMSYAVPSWLGKAPHWKAVPAPREDALTRPLAPSRPEGRVFGMPDAVRSPLERVSSQPLSAPDRQGRRGLALERGTAIHRLLQSLPEVSPEERRVVAQTWLGRSAPGISNDERATVIGAVMTVLEHPDLAPLFAPGSRAEQPISGISQGRVILGQVDRLRVADRQIWLCDYKTNRKPPARVERVPVAYLRQMSAYRDVLMQIYPHCVVHCVLVWTEGPVIHRLPPALLTSV